MAGIPAAADVWPFHATVPVTETLEWLTDVLPSRVQEQRLALRDAPRQTIAYSVRLSDAQFTRAKAFARRLAASVVGVPVWHEAIILTSDVSASDTSIALDTTTADWRIDSGVLIWESAEKYVVARITSISAGSLGLSEEIGTEFRRPFIIPLRPALVPEGFSIDRQAVYSDVGVKFLVTDNIDLSASWVSDYPKYQGLDVVTEKPVLVSDIAESIVWGTDYVDSGLGSIRVETKRDYVDFGQTVSFLEKRPAGLWRRRKWLHSLKGKQKPFWLPSFNQDLALQASIGSSATAIVVRSIGPVESYAGRHVMILLKNGTRFLRAINGAVSAGGGNDAITISSSLGQAVTPADIALFCFLSKVRLNADSVSIDHRYVDSSVVSIPVIEVPA